MNLEQLAETISGIDKDPNQTLSYFKKLQDEKVIVACSGGPDSVALALLCKFYELDFALAYIEHGINPSTLQCETIVKNLAEELEVPFFSTHLNMASEGKAEKNIEAVARNERYIALEKLREIHGYRFVLTAHHLDDLAETFLINLLRGTGSGASSLVDKRDSILRPILNWRKSELNQMVQRMNIDAFEDEMNEDPRFVRNRVRKELIPLMEDISGRDVSRLISRASLAIQADNIFLDSLAKSLWPKDSASTKSLLALDPVLQTHAIRAWIGGLPPSMEELERILQVVRHEITRTQISDNRTIWRSGAVLYQDVTPKPKPKN